jgi:beta-lactamase regulating signal transducer with metallopeptidase domain
MSVFALDVVVRALVVLAIAWLAAGLFRRSSAALRAGVWTAAFCGLLLLPVLVRVTPTWRLRVLPAERGALSAAVDLVARDAAQPSSLMTAPDAGISSPAVTAVAPVDQLRAADRVVATAEAPSAVTPLPIGTVLGLTWLLGTAFLLVRIGSSHIRAARVAQRMAHDASAPEDFCALVDSTRGSLRVSRRVGVHLTDAVAVPVVVGVFQPTLLVPIDATEWTEAERQVVVLHELAHVARWDGLGQLASQAACALYWFLPHLWIGARRAAGLREHATDDAVLRAGVRPSSYAARLIELAQRAAGLNLCVASLAMASPRHIDRRVAAILNPSMRRGRLTLASAMALAIAAGATVTLLASVTPAHRVLVDFEDQFPVPPPPPPVPPAPAPEPPPAPMPLARLPEPPPPPPSAPLAVPPAPEPPAFAPVPPPPPPVAPSRYLTAPAPVPPWPPFDAPVPPPAPPVPPTAMQGPQAPPPPPSARPASPAPPAPPAPADSLCGTGTNSSSNSVHEDDRSRLWTVTATGRGCNVSLRVEGKVDFNDDFTDVSRLSTGGTFRLDVDRNGARHELTINERNGALTREWRVNGTARPWDDEGRTWLADFLIELDRHTAVGVDQRLPRLLQKGGVAGVLAETALMSGDYPRSVYYTKLSRSTTLSKADIAKLLDQAASLTTSDYYASELLSSLGRQATDDPGVHDAILRLIDHMSSDYYIVEGVSAGLGPRPMSAGDIAFLVRIAPRVKADYYKAELVDRAAASGRADARQRAELAQVTKGMHEDYYTASVISKLAGDGMMDDAGRATLIDATTHIRSDSYIVEAFSALMRGSQVKEADLLKMVDGTRRMSSDYYKAEILTDVARHRSASAHVRDAVLDASTGLSQYYRDSVRRAAGGR